MAIPKLQVLHLHLLVSQFNYALFADMMQSREGASELLHVTLQFLQTGLDEKAKHALQLVSTQKRTVKIIVWAVEDHKWSKE
jgi:hypothetical protein